MEESELKYCWMLHEIAKDLGVAKNLPAILNLIVKSAVDSLNIKASSIRLLDPEGKRLELAAAYGLSEEYLRKGPVELDKSPIDKEAMTGRTVEVEDVTRERILQYHDEAVSEGIRSIICVPLRVRDRIIGSLRAYTSLPHRFNEAEKTFLSALANLGAIAIENAKLTESLRRRIDGLSKLVEVSKGISPSLKVEEVFGRIVRTASEMFKAKGASLSMLDKGVFKPVSHHGISEASASKLAAPSPEELEELLKGSTIAIPDVEGSSLKYKATLISEGVKALLCSPITSKGKVVGALKVYFSEKRRFDDGEDELLSILASLSGISIDNAKLYRLALSNWENLLKEVWEKLDVWGSAE
ncbi:MAG: GAF domain-containing protein [Candidatus Bathyarchaeia archaeon]